MWVTRTLLPAYFGWFFSWLWICHHMHALIGTELCVVKSPPATAGDARDAGSTLGSGRSPGGGNGNPLQYSCPDNSMIRGACRPQSLHWSVLSWKGALPPADFWGSSVLSALQTLEFGSQTSNHISSVRKTSRFCPSFPLLNCNCQAVSWDSHRGHFIITPSLRDHSLVLPGRQGLKTFSCVLSDIFLVV